MSDASKDSPIDFIEAPPTSIGGILTRLGPGLIIAGSIVGSGELIATTATGAEAGFWLLWLILLGCVIKVFVQVEFGRYSIATGQGTMEGLEQVPGPRIRGRGNWLVWYWVLMFSASLAQLGGIVGGVGQALAISVPLTAKGRAYNAQMSIETKYRVALAELKMARQTSDGEQVNTKRIGELEADLAKLAPQMFAAREGEIQAALQRLPTAQGDAKSPQAKAYERAVAIVRARSLAFPHQPQRVFATRQQLAAILIGEQRQTLGEDFDEDQAQRTVERQLAAIDTAANLPPDAAADSAADKLLPKLGQRTSNDHKWWAALIAVVTSIVLMNGRYSIIQVFSTFMVAVFTIITIVNLVALQRYGEWAVSWQDIANGMSFRLPPTNKQALGIALSAFGIIGVGASELIAYPYWCLERGYARYTGPRDKSDAWANRARGWLRVMRWDAWCSMAVYTFATIAFYLLGAAILGRIHFIPEGTEMIRTLSLMYAPVFGSFTQILFLFGAFAVLYSTFFVANAGQARMCADAMQVTGLAVKKHDVYRRNVRWLSGLFPLVCLAVLCLVDKPVMLVMFSGLMQAMMLPMLSAAALYFRYRRCDGRIMPTVLWDVFLWASAAGMLVTGVWAAKEALFRYFGG